MSLEAALAENTAAVRELAALLKGARVTAPIAAAPEKPQAAPTPAPEAKPAAAAPAAPAAPAEPQAEAKKIAYGDVSAAVLKYVAKASKDAAVKVLREEFHVPNAKELKPEQWPAVIARFNALVTE